MKIDVNEHEALIIKAVLNTRLDAILADLPLYKAYINVLKSANFEVKVITKVIKQIDDEK